MNALVNWRLDGAVGIVEFDNPPVNALSHGVRVGLADALDRLEDEAVQALIIVCAGKGFFSGADIKEFGKPMLEPQLPELIERIEAASKPVIAAIHGKGLGGGLELALACHYRVATRDASVGLPEVKLGIIPGSGGTQRLPRLIGVEAALELIAEGREVKAAKALELGILDAVVDGDLTAGAIDFARQALAEKRGGRRVSQLPVPAHDDSVYEEATTKVRRKQRGYQAPLVAIEVIRNGLKMPFEEALAYEYAECVKLLRGPQSRALRHNFAAERAVTRVPGLEGVAERPVNSVAVIGLGAMGAGIAVVFANAGIPVVGIERDQAKLDKSMERIARTYDGLIKRGSLTDAQKAERLARITPAVSYDQLKDVDLVIEAVTEDMEIKRDVFAKLGEATREGAILASNTSYLDINALAAASGRPADVCGMHFFNPANIMRLLENVRAEATSPEVVATITGLARRIGKLPVLSGVCDGFIVNRMLAKRSREGFFMLEEGAKPSQIDKIIQGFGFPMGPYALADLAGIDVQYAARQARWERLTERERQANFVDQMYERGRYGQKTGAGWYRYGEDRKSQPDPDVDQLLADHAAARGIAPRPITDEEVLERCIYAMVNEGAKILDEGVAQRPEDIDVAMINGLGFPAYTGGPMWWADEIGLPKVLEAILRYRDLVGAEYWTPAPLLERLAREGKGFYSA